MTGFNSLESWNLQYDILSEKSMSEYTSDVQNMGISMNVDESVYPKMVGL